MKLTKIPLTPSEEERIKQVDDTFEKGSLIKVKEVNQVYQAPFDFEVLKNFEIFDDDIFVVTAPKCGTTWMQEIVWLMLNDVDVERAKTLNQFYRFPYLEYEFVEPDTRPYPEGEPLTEDNLLRYVSHSLEYTRRRPRPRLIKTHAKLKFLPDNLLDTCKVIFVARNVKDMAVSLYHHKSLKRSSVTRSGFKMFAKIFKDALVPEAPGIDLMLEAWALRSHPNMLFVTYEELQADFDAVARRIMTFLGVSLTDEKYALLKRATMWESFRQNRATNKETEFPTSSERGSFIRKGKVGDWKNYFDDDLNAEWDSWINERVMGTDYNMTFEL